MYTLLSLAKYTRLYNPSAEPSCLFNSLSNHSLEGSTIWTKLYHPSEDTYRVELPREEWSVNVGSKYIASYDLFS